VLINGRISVVECVAFAIDWIVLGVPPRSGHCGKEE
jgi:hypothetical protein